MFPPKENILKSELIAPKGNWSSLKSKTLKKNFYVYAPYVPALPSIFLNFTIFEKTALLSVTLVKFSFKW